MLTAAAFAQQKIGLIDLYGNRKVAAATIHQALYLSPGDTVDVNSFNMPALRTRLQAIPGVRQAAVDLVCCDDSTGGAILYIGIAESNQQSFVYHATPRGRDSLPALITSTYEAYMRALIQAVNRGQSAEDHDAGYSLLQDTAARRLQLQFITLAQQYRQQLHTVLHRSGNADQRAMAATVLAYGPDRPFIVKELMYAVRDAAEEVRNNATRALWVLADHLNQHPDSSITIPATPFISMLNSIVWTDRNKGSLVLFALTEQRPPVLLAQLRKDCLPALIEMARWRNRGHAFQAYMLLGRIAGVSEADCFNAFNGHHRGAYLEEMLDTIHTQ